MERSPEHGSIEVTGQKALTSNLGTASPWAAAEHSPSLEYMTTRDYWRAARNHIWVFSSILLLGTLGVGVWMVRMPDYYDCTARVEINVTSRNPAVGDGRNEMVVVDDDPAYFNTEIQNITSPTLLRGVIASLGLDHDKIFNRHLRKGGRILHMLVRMFFWGKTDSQVGLTVDKGPLPSDLQSSDTPGEAAEGERLFPYVDDLQKRITIEPVKEARSSTFKDTRLVDITLRYQNPQMGARIVNAIADSLVLQNREKEESNNSGAGQYLKQRVAELQEEIRTGQENLLSYSKNHEILSLDPGENITLDRLVSLNRQLVDAENDRKIAEANYFAATKPDAAVALAYDDTKEIADAEARLPDLEQKRAQLLVTETEKYPDVEEVNQEIAAIEANVEAIRQRAIETVLTNLQTKFQQALGHEQAIRETFEEQKKTTVTQNEAAVNYRLIEQQIETNKSLLNGLLERQGQNEVAAAGTADNIRVTDYAVEPDKVYPDGPWRLLWVSLAFLVSSMLAVGAAVFLEHLDDTLRSSKDVRSVLQTSCLAVIPSVALSRLPRLLPRAASLNLNGGGDRREVASPDRNAPPYLAEAYRRLRTAVLLAGGKRPPKKILVTSSTMGEGKSTVVANLAMSLAKTGAKVLVIDGDLRRPRQQTLFSLENKAGLRDLLSEPSDESTVLGLVQSHIPSGVYVLTSGKEPANPAELLGSERMGHLLELLEKKFDHIVVDSPALASCTDPVLLSLVTDGTLLVVQGGQSPREVVRYSYEQLRSAGARILGVVLNNVGINSSEPQDYYYTYYGKD